MELSLILVILFYLSIILIVYLNRDKFQIYAKIIALYRTQLGLKSMSWLAKRIPRTIKFLSFIGIFFGFLGMIYISYILVDGAIALIANPEAPPVITPVIPGIKIPGSPIFVPFWYGIISIFIVAAIHEFSHGVVATAYNIKVKNSGIVFFGPIIGAFVEPDEKKLRKASFKEQLSVFSAGPFSNILTGIIVLVLLSFLIVPLTNSLVEPDGVYISSVEKDLPADLGGIESGYIVRSLDNNQIETTTNFSKLLLARSPGEEISFSDGKTEHKVVLGENPKNKSIPYLGIMHSQNSRLKSEISGSWVPSYIPWSFFYLKDLLVWLFILSVGIGLANLLPIGPADGGRILHLTLQKLFDYKRVIKIWGLISSAVIFLLLFNLFFPYIRYIF